MFKIAEKIGRAELDDLGRRMEARYRELKGEGRSRMGVVRSVKRMMGAST